MSKALDSINELIASDVPIGPELYNSIVSILTQDSFKQIPENVVAKLKLSLPILDSKLREVPVLVQSLKLATDVAKQVGYYEIHSMKRNEEYRLIFEAALLLLLHIGIQRQVYLRNLQYYESYSEFHNTYTLLDKWTSRNLDIKEQFKLVAFSNFMKTVLLLTPNPKLKRAHLIDIVTRVCEGKKKYITGAGQSADTTRR